jgi:hypothetical protein
VVACGEDEQAGLGYRVGTRKEFLRLPAKRMDKLHLALELDLGRNSCGCLRRGWTGWNWLWNQVWEGILEAGCGEDGQASLGSGAGSGKEFSRLPAKRMDRLELALELDLRRNSRRQAGIGVGAGSRQEFERLLAERMDRLELAPEHDLRRHSCGCLRRG